MKDLIEQLDKNIPEDVLTVGRLIAHLMKYNPSIPVKVMDGNKQLAIRCIGASPVDNDAWDGEYEMPADANWYEIQVLNEEEL